MNIQSLGSLCFVITGMVMSCSTLGLTEDPSIKTRASSPTPPGQALSQNASIDQSVRSFDFGNFTYPWVSDLDPKKSFTLSGGRLAETRDAKRMIDKMGV